MRSYNYDTANLAWVKTDRDFIGVIVLLHVTDPAIVPLFAPVPIDATFVPDPSVVGYKSTGVVPVLGLNQSSATFCAVIS